MWSEFVIEVETEIPREFRTREKKKGFIMEMGELHDWQCSP